MKREIEFRGKTAKGEWVYGSFINSVVKGSAFGYIAGNNVVEAIQVIRKTVGRYVGITDKNGKKVYEGDILRVNNSTKSGVVEIKDFEIRCDIDGVKHRIEYETVYEVIGTVFDKEGEENE